MSTPELEDTDDMSNIGSDLPERTHRQSIESRLSFDGGLSSSSPQVPAEQGHDISDDEGGCTQARCAPPPFAMGAQGGFSYPAWPTSICNTMGEEEAEEEDSCTSAAPVNISQSQIEVAARIHESEVPHSAPAAPVKAAARAAQAKQHPQQQQQQQQQRQQRQKQKQKVLLLQQQRKQQLEQKQQQKLKQKLKQRQATPTKGDGRGECCQTRNCTEPPSYSEDGHKPAVRCRHHRKDGMFRVQHGNKTCGVAGCTRDSEVHYMDQNSRIHRFCAQHREPSVVLEQALRCEHGDCNGTPRYGTRDGPLNYCQAHKRAGLYTIRDGTLYVATRDGSAFRDEATAASDSSSVKSGAATPTSSALAPESTSAAVSPLRKTAQPLAASTPSTTLAGDTKAAPSVSSKNRSSPHKKSCEAPGCEVQPNYGEAGSSKARFCFVHKDKTHISLKNRPCSFPGCVTRPHYGPSGGRAVFCVTHKKKKHVHLHKESENLAKKVERKRRDKPASAHSCGKKKGRPVNDGDEIEHAGPKKPSKGANPAVKPTHDGGKRDEKWEGKGKGEDKSKGKGKGKGNGKGTARGDGAAQQTAAVVVKAAGYTTSKAAKKPAESKAKATPEGLERVEVARGSSLSATSAPPPPPRPLNLPVPRAVEAPPGLRIALSDHGVFPRGQEPGNGPGGRRARAPSRKLLEAAGKVEDEGVQLLTKEKKEEEARHRMEIREQRKAAKTAGLRLGQVIEATAVPLSFSGGEAGSGSWDSDMSGAFSAGEVAPSNLSWRKLNPAETLRAAQLRRQQQQQQQQKRATEEASRMSSSAENTITEAASPARTTGKRGRPGSGATPAEAAAPTADGDGEKSGEKMKGSAVSAAAAAMPEASSRPGSTATDPGDAATPRKRGRSAKGATGGGGKGQEERGTVKKKEGKRKSPRVQGEGHGANKVGGKSGRGRVACEVGSCSEPACYGIGDTVRHCKTHKMVAAL